MIKPKVYFASVLEYLMDKVKDYKMSPEEADAQAKSFVYGNCKLHNPHVTREMVDKLFEDRNNFHKGGKNGH